ncbi:MAG: ribosome recycling factor [Bacilli bacterium]|nr:ribosome recycling factor [Bacilli bacterium]
MINDLLSSLDDRMEKAIGAVKRDFSTLRAGRATPGMLDRVTVDYYGSQMPINQLANVTVPEPRMLVITPWDKSSLKEIERSIISSDLGITPSNDGSIIRLAIPQPTEQRRLDLGKQARKMAEEGRIAIRNIRRDVNEDIKKLEKSGDISEDDSHRAQERVQDATNKFVEEIEKLLSAKEKEITEV